MHKVYEKFFKKYYGNSGPAYQKMVTTFLERLPKPKDVDADFVMDFIAPYAPHTQKMFMGYFRNLFRYLGRFSEIEGIRPKRIKIKITPKDLYSVEEIKKMIESCDRPQDRAMIEVLYESACRIGEMASMMFENLKWMPNGAVAVLVTGKSGTRAVYLYESVPTLRNWVNAHPKKKGALWIGHKAPFKPVKPNTIYFRIEQILNKAGITRKVPRKAHLMRHSRLTSLAKILTPSELAKVAGWTDTRQAQIYVHLSQKDIEVAMLQKVYGLDPEDDDVSITQKLSAKECPKCGTRNPSTAIRCEVCNAPLIVGDLDKLIDDKISSKLLEIAAAGLEKQIEDTLKKMKENKNEA